MTRTQRFIYAFVIILCYYIITYIRGYFHTIDIRALQCSFYHILILFIFFSDKRLNYMGIISIIIGLIFVFLALIFSITPSYLFLIGLPIIYIMYKIFWYLYEPRPNRNIKN